MQKLIDRLPAALASRLQTKFGKQFLRFAPVAVASLGASQLALALFIGPMHLTAGVSGFSAAVVGAVVSYFLSRWAWKRKGRPNLWRETIPFWMVSVGAWGVLALATKLGVYITRSLDLHHLMRHLVIGGVYLAANCVTFAARFLIFHYVLFADREAKADASSQAPAGLIETESLSPVTVPAAAQDPDQPNQ
jgi:putative flippase GtrA